jgi:tetratricopeptide (TPR) repeat protein
MLESLSVAQPADKRTRRVLALGYERIGDLLSGYGQQHAEALAMHQKALAIEDELLSPDPENTVLRRLRAWEMLRIGDELRAQADGAKALQNYREAANTLRALSMADPKNLQFHADVANARARLGVALLDSGNARAALPELEGALSELSGSTDPQEITLTQFRIGKAYETLKDRSQARLRFQKSIPSLEAAKKAGLLEGSDAALLDQARRVMNR